MGVVQICTIGLGPRKPSPTSPTWCHRNGTSRTGCYLVPLALLLPFLSLNPTLLLLGRNFRPQTAARCTGITFSTLSRPVHARLGTSMEVRFGHLWQVWGALGAGQDYARARSKGSGLSGIMIKTPIPLILLWYILVPDINPQQQRWLGLCITYIDNGATSNKDRHSFRIWTIHHRYISSFCNF
ncbi:hypothetical protein EV421DRAFT_539994 [Armillaria borealis]|uniref:Uncharacterized protein n=1 Tax=Armillaria borealis TaxID=47425 RepID=A0AA39MQE9_9AGAR|nr:hypothetical protein EV421DRAFT_539994 [Armillaria borealis]